MKHVKKILATFMAMTMLCGVAVGVGATGVTFTEGYLFDICHGDYRYDETIRDYVWVSREPTDNMYSALNDWLINTPYWAVDIFAPGYTTQHLRNDPKADGKTIDFEITPYEGFKETVIVADIPEEYHEVYDEFISGERKTDPYATLTVSNIVRKKDHLKLDYAATGKFGSKWDEYGYDVLNLVDLRLYGITTDKETGEIIRYDYVMDFWVSLGDSYYYPYISINPDENPNVKDATIPFPSDFDPEKHEYGFCFIAFDCETYNWVFRCDTPVIYNYTKVDVPEWNKVLGDADGNGTVGATDVIYAARKFAGGKGRINWDADMDDDNAMTAKDCSMLRRYIVSKN